MHRIVTAVAALAALLLTTVGTAILLQSLIDPGPCRDTVMRIVEPSASPMCAAPVWPKFVALGAGMLAATVVIVTRTRQRTA